MKVKVTAELAIGSWSVVLMGKNKKESAEYHIPLPPPPLELISQELGMLYGPLPWMCCGRY